MLSQQRLNEMFTYNEGHLYWKEKVTDKVVIGKMAGYNRPDRKNKNGYIVIKINKINFPAHRIIYTMFYGDIPNGMKIDHKDRVKNNNKIDNLRLCTCVQNTQNIGKTVANTSGYKGVSAHKLTKRWRARIYINKKETLLGFFDTKEEAFNAYKEAAIKIHGEFANFD